MNNMNHVYQALSSDIKKVDHYITHALCQESDAQIIQKVANHIISSNGKRLRPILVLLSAKMFNVTGDSHHKLAAAIEIMHTATLLHDDVVDSSTKRRGKESAHIMWGNKTSVLVGDFLLGCAFRLMVQANSMQALDILSNSACTIAKGEINQLLYSFDTTLLLDEYLKIIRYKTATLFQAACAVGAVVANQKSVVIDALAAYGINLGMAFQIQDDVMDYLGQERKIGKTLGKDFYEGKITLPLILAFQAIKNNNFEKEKLVKIIKKNSRKENDFNDVLALFEKNEVAKSSHELLVNFIKKSQTSFYLLPKDLHENEFSFMFLDVLAFCAGRDF